MNDNTENPVSRLRITIRRIAIFMAVSIIMLCVAFSYGSNTYYPAALAFLLASGVAAYKLSRKLGVILCIIFLISATLWPLDALLTFPVLRCCQSLVPFGPGIKVYPSPSGKSSAYIYDYGFLDSAYLIKFSHGFWFPEHDTWIPSEKADFNISPRWNADTFIVTNDSSSFTLVYFEVTNKIKIIK